MFLENAHAKCTRVRGRTALQNTSPRRTRARSTRARAAAADKPAAASTAAETATASTAATAATASVYMSVPPHVFAIQKHFDNAHSLHAVVGDAGEPALPHTMWERDIERRVASFEKILQMILSVVLVCIQIQLDGSR